MIPEVKFVFSPIYNYFFEKFVKFPKNGKKFPNVEEVDKNMKELEKAWRKKDKKILKSLADYTNLEWQEKVIKCYFVGKCKPFSEPLTICPRRDAKETLNLLIHELTHQLIYQNRADKKVAKMFQYFEKKYKKESRLTINHIIIHAIHSKIYLKYFDKKELNRNIERDQKDKNYSRSWEIVNGLGYEKIIDQLRRGIWT